MLLQPPPPPDSPGLLVLWLPMGAHAGTGGSVCTQMPVFACACPCICLGYSGHLGLLASPFLAPMVWSQCINARSVGVWGGISPHPSSRQRGRGEGGVNLPTALLIAHMPGHQEPAVTVETISTPPSPSLHGVGLRQGIKHPPTHLSLLPFSLCLPLLHLSLLPLSVLLSTSPLSPHPPPPSHCCLSSFPSTS